MALKDRVDVLAIEAPATRNTPADVLTILRSAQTSVLIYRSASMRIAEIGLRSTAGTSLLQT